MTLLNGMGTKPRCCSSMVPCNAGKQGIGNSSFRRPLLIEHHYGQLLPRFIAQCDGTLELHPSAGLDCTVSYASPQYLELSRWKAGQDKKKKTRTGQNSNPVIKIAL